MDVRPFGIDLGFNHPKLIVTGCRERRHILYLAYGRGRIPGCKRGNLTTSSAGYGSLCGPVVKILSRRIKRFHARVSTRIPVVELVSAVKFRQMGKILATFCLRVNSAARTVEIEWLHPIEGTIIEGGAV